MARRQSTLPSRSRRPVLRGDLRPVLRGDLRSVLRGDLRPEPGVFWKHGPLCLLLLPTILEAGRPYYDNNEPARRRQDTGSEGRLAERSRAPLAAHRAGTIPHPQPQWSHSSRIISQSGMFDGGVYVAIRGL